VSAAERPQRRHRSDLVDEPPWRSTAAEEAERDAAPGIGDVGQGDGAARRRGPEGGRHPAEPRARTVARNAAWGWAAAVRRTDERTRVWADEMRAARALGTVPALLREFVREAAAAAEVPESSVPPVVWEAAGLVPPGG